MATFNRSDDLRGALFVGVDLGGARFVKADLSGVVMRGVGVQGVEIDSPWLFDADNTLVVNGVDVLGLIIACQNNHALPPLVPKERHVRQDTVAAAVLTAQRGLTARLLFSRVADLVPFPRRRVAKG